jgi:hypothetical protein
MPQFMQNLNTSGHSTLTRMPCRFSGASDLVNIITPPAKMKFQVTLSMYTLKRFANPRYFVPNPKLISLQIHSLR